MTKDKARLLELFSALSESERERLIVYFRTLHPKPKRKRRTAA